MTFRSLPTNSTTTARSYRDLYQLTHNNAQPAETFRESQAFSYMDAALDDGSTHRAFNLALFNNAEARAFLLQQVGFNPADIATVQTILQNPTTEDSQRLRDGLEGHLNDLQRSIFRGMRIVAGYEQPSASGGGNIANPEDRRDIGNPNIISAYEIEENAGAAAGTFTGQEYHNEIKAQTRTINGILGLLEYVTTQPPPPPRTSDVRAPETHAATDSITFAAPQGGWQAGDQIFINGTQWSAPTTGTAQVSIPGSALGAGANTIEVRNGTNTWVTLPVVIQAPEPEEASGETSWVGEHSTELAIGGTAAAAVLVTALAAFFRIRGVRRVEGEARAKAEGEARNARGELGAAELRVRELSDAVAGARGQVEAARMSPEARVEAEARVREIEERLARAQDKLAAIQPQVRGIEGTRFEDIATELETKQTELAGERVVVEDLQGRGVAGDAPEMVMHNEAIAHIEADVSSLEHRAGQEAIGQARGNARNARERAMTEFFEARARARAEVRSIEQELRGANGVLTRDAAIGNAIELLAARPSTPAPVPPAPPPVAPVPPPLPPNP